MLKRRRKAPMEGRGRQFRQDSQNAGEVTGKEVDVNLTLEALFKAGFQASVKKYATLRR